MNNGAAPAEDNVHVGMIGGGTIGDVIGGVVGIGKSIMGWDEYTTAVQVCPLHNSHYALSTNGVISLLWIMYCTCYI